MREYPSLKYRFAQMLVGAILGIVVGLFLKGCLDGENTDSVTVTSDTSITKNQTTDSTVQGTKGKDSLVYIIIPGTHSIDTHLQKVDSGAIIRDYFQTKVYTNRYITDQLDETIIDTVTGSAITGRKRLFTVTCNDTTITVKETITKSANGLYIGAQLSQKDIAPSVMYLKGRSAYGISYGLNNKEIKGYYFYRLGK